MSFWKSLESVNSEAVTYEITIIPDFRLFRSKTLPDGWTIVPRSPLQAFSPRAQKINRYLRNRKHVPCSYRVIETRVKVWENEKCCGNTRRRQVFPQLFRVLPHFHECFYNSIGTRRTCFLFLLENTATKKKKNNLFTSIIKM